MKPSRGVPRLAARVVAALLAAVLTAGCGGGTEDTGNGVISVSPRSLAFSGPSPAPQTISVSYAAPPTEVVLAGHPGGSNPTCIGPDATCRLEFTLTNGAGSNPQIYSVTILDTSAAHTSTLRFVSTDLGFQVNFGQVDVAVTYSP